MDRRVPTTTESAGPRRKERRAPTLRARAGPRHKECQAPTQSAGERAPERTAGPRHKAPGPDTQKERRSPTQSAGPRHSEGEPGHDTNRRAPTQRAPGPDTKKECRAPTQSAGPQQPLTCDSAMCSSKKAKLATIHPIYFCPCCLGSVLVYFFCFFLLRCRGAASISGLRCLTKTLQICCDIKKGCLLYVPACTALQ